MKVSLCKYKPVRYLQFTGDNIEEVREFIHEICPDAEIKYVGERINRAIIDDMVDFRYVFDQEDLDREIERLQSFGYTIQKIEPTKEASTIIYEKYNQYKSVLVPFNEETGFPKVIYSKHPKEKYLDWDPKELRVESQNSRMSYWIKPNEVMIKGDGFLLNWRDEYDNMENFLKEYDILDEEKKICYRKDNRNQYEYLIYNGDNIHEVEEFIKEYGTNFKYFPSLSSNPNPENEYNSGFRNRTIIALPNRLRPEGIDKRSLPWNDKCFDDEDEEKRGNKEYRNWWYEENLRLSYPKILLMLPPDKEDDPHAFYKEEHEECWEYFDIGTVIVKRTGKDGFRVFENKTFYKFFDLIE